MTCRACRLGAALACALMGTAQAAPLPWTEEMIEDAGAREGATGTPTNQAPASTPGSQPIGKAAATDSLGAQMVESLTVPMTAADPADADRPPWLREFLATMPPENVRVDLGDGKVIEISPDETLALAAGLLARGKRSEVKALAKAVSAAGGDKAKACALEAAVALAERRLGDARDAFFRAAEAKPEPPMYRVNGLVVALNMADEATRASAVVELARHAGREDAAGLAAETALLGEARARGDKPGIAFRANKLIRHPAAGWPAKRAALDSLSSIGAEQDLSAAIEGLLSASREDAPGAFGLLRWLNAHGRADRVPSWVADIGETRCKAVPLSFAVAEAYAKLGRWDALGPWLQGSDWTGIEPLRDFMRALCEGQGKTAGGEAWDRAIAEAKRLPGGLQTLLGLAENCGWSAATDALLWEIASIQRDPRHTLRHLFGRYQSQRDAQGMRRVMRRVHEVDPDDWIAANNLAHLELLLQGDVPHAGQLAEKNYLARPTEPAVATTYAFFLLRSGRANDIPPVLQSLTQSAATNPQARLFHAVFLAATGNHAAATESAKGLNEEEFLPEEWELLKAAHISPQKSPQD